MTDAERVNALLDLVDADRVSTPEASAALIVLGLAVRRGKIVVPTNAGWHLVGDRGRMFDQTYRHA